MPGKVGIEGKLWCQLVRLGLESEGTEELQMLLGATRIGPGWALK